ncbi:MAG: phosphatase PAP2 family protein [Gemmatimonadales bacterium]|nr:phosphatase PAP2 family protein [Gemmatimonadales bacterium]
MRALDRIVAAFAAVLGLAALARAPGQPGARWIVVAALLLALLAWLMPRLGHASAPLRTLRELYPLVLLSGLYSALDVLIPPGAVLHDATVLGWEQALFGGQPSRDWWRAAPSIPWSVTLHAAYLAYYPLLVLPPAWFALRRDLPALRRAALAITAAFLLCYVVFLLFPVAGPYYVFPQPTGPFVAHWAARAVYGLLATGSSYGAAFPSSHVAAAVVACWATWRGAPRLGALTLPPTMLLVVATVYCQMHYAVDAAAGLLVALLVAAAVHAWERRPHTGPVLTGP